MDHYLAMAVSFTGDVSKAMDGLLAFLGFVSNSSGYVFKVPKAISSNYVIGTIDLVTTSNGPITDVKEDGVLRQT